MFQKGSLIVYGNTGVCIVQDVGAPPDSSISNKNKLYYRLSPVRRSGTIYIPVDTDIFMRPVITKEEAHRLIARIPQIAEYLCCSRVERVLVEHYRSSFKTHCCDDLVQLIKTVYAKNQLLGKSGKKLCRTDLQFKEKAEEFLYGELSVVLEIPYDTVESYIEQELSRLKLQEGLSIPAFTDSFTAALPAQ